MWDYRLRKYLKAIDKGVIINFRDNNVVIARFRNQNDVIFIFMTKCHDMSRYIMICHDLYDQKAILLY